MGETLLSGLVRAGRRVDRAAGRREAPRARPRARGAVRRRRGLQPRGRPRRRHPRAGREAAGHGRPARRDRAARCARASCVVSLAAGITTAFIEARLPDGVAVVRVMPNTPALVDEGMAAISPGSHCDEEHLAEAEELLGSTGRVLRVPEKQQDAVTAISGSGPAYLFFVVEAMIEAGVHLGLPRVDRDRARRADRRRLGEDAPRDRRPPGRAARAGHLAGRHHRRGAARARDPQGAGRVPGRDGGRARPLVASWPRVPDATTPVRAAARSSLLMEEARRGRSEPGPGQRARDAARRGRRCRAHVGQRPAGDRTSPTRAGRSSRHRRSRTALRRAGGPGWASGCSCSVGSPRAGSRCATVRRTTSATGTWRRLLTPIPMTTRDRAVAAAGVAVLRHARRPGGPPSGGGTTHGTTPGRGCARCPRTPPHRRRSTRRSTRWPVVASRSTACSSAVGRPCRSTRCARRLAHRRVRAGLGGTVVTGYAGAARSLVADRWDGRSWHRIPGPDRASAARLGPLPDGVPARGATRIPVGARLLVVAGARAWIHTP